MKNPIRILRSRQFQQFKKSFLCTYAIIALMIHKGVHVLFQNHAQRRPDFRRGRKLGPRGHIIEWNKPPRKPAWMVGRTIQGIA